MITFNAAIDASAVARVVGINVQFQNLRASSAFLLPMVVGLVGQGNDLTAYSLDKFEATSAQQVADRYGYGSPLHLAALELKPVVGAGGLGTIPLIIHPLDAAGGSTASVGIYDGVGVATKNAAVVFKVNNIRSNQVIFQTGESFADRAADIRDAINAVLKMPVIAAESAGTVTATAKASGEIGEDLVIEVEAIDFGITFALTQPTGGAGSPDVQPALDQVGNVWETMLIDCNRYNNTTILDVYQAWGEGRWESLIHKPAIVFRGYTGLKADIGVITDARRDDRINSQVSSPSSNDLPYVVAAAEVAEIASLANNNPPVDYGSVPVSSLQAAADNLQLGYNERDSAVKKGASTIEVKDGVVNLSDIVTMYHPDGEPEPPFRYVVDIVKEMNVIYNLALIFQGKPWDGAPLVPDGQTVNNPAARKPKNAVSECSGLQDELGEAAILSAPEETKPLITASIVAPKRIDVCFPHYLSGNANLIGVDSKFSFYVS